MTPGNDSEHVRDCNCVAAACLEFGCAVAAGFATRPLVEPVTTCDCCGAIGHTNTTAISYVDPSPGTEAPS